MLYCSFCVPSTTYNQLKFQMEKLKAFTSVKTCIHRCLLCLAFGGQAALNILQGWQNVQASHTEKALIKKAQSACERFSNSLQGRGELAGWKESHWIDFWKRISLKNCCFSGWKIIFAPFCAQTHSTCQDATVAFLEKWRNLWLWVDSTFIILELLNLHNFHLHQWF